MGFPRCVRVTASIPQLLNHPHRIATATYLDRCRIISPQQHVAGSRIVLRKAVTADHDLVAAVQRLSSLAPPFHPAGNRQFTLPWSLNIFTGD